VKEPYKRAYIVQITCDWRVPLTEEIRLQIFASPDYMVKFGSADYTVLPYNQGTPVFFRENVFEISGTPVKTCLKVTGTPVKIC